MADVKAKVKTPKKKALYPDCTRYPGSAGVLYLAVYPECLVQF